MNKSYSSPDISSSRFYISSDIQHATGRKSHRKGNGRKDEVSDPGDAARLESYRYEKRSSVDASRAIKVKRRIIRRSKQPAVAGAGAVSSAQSDDDASSVCSDHSTSPVGRRKRLRRIRRSCPIHGKQHLLKKYGEKAFDMPEFRMFLCHRSTSSCSPMQVSYDASVGDMNVLPAVHEEEPVCTCDHEKTQSRTHSVAHKSPKSHSKPERGHFSNLDADDFHKLIYENQPLFSDLENDSDIDQSIKEESDRYHKRSSQAFKNIFSSALCYNPSTMMKFAIIQNEVRNLMEGHLKVVRKSTSMPKLFAWALAP